MRFTNFDLKEPFGATVLVGLGHEWDVHSWADLTAVRQTHPGETAVLEWHVPTDVSNPWGSLGNNAAGCRLVFSGVRSFRITAGTAGVEPRDARTVAAISKAIPGEGAYPFKASWGDAEEFELRVETEDAGRIDIDA